MIGTEDIESQSGQGGEVAEFKRERTADTEQPLAQYHLEPEFTAEHYARQSCEPRDPFLDGSLVPGVAGHMSWERGSRVLWGVTADVVYVLDAGPSVPGSQALHPNILVHQRTAIQQVGPLTER